MSKKIVISESQYRRVFLSEQKTIEKPSVVEIQKFLNKKGFTDYEGKKLKYDGWGDRTASAFAKYFLGNDTPVKNSKDLWVALKIQGLDVGSSYKSTTKMVNAIVDAINYKESPTTGIKDFFTDLIGGEDGVGISWENMSKFWDRTQKFILNTDTLSTNANYESKIKSKDDGDKFRQWIHTKPNKLKEINKTLNDVGLDNLDITGPHDNINFLIAWKMEGDSYYLSTKPKEKKLTKYDKFKIENKEYENVDLETFEKQRGDISTELKDRIRRSKMYETYLKAKNTRSTLSNSFGWKGPVEISSKNLNSILTGKVLSSTAINPENILAEFELIKLSLVGELNNPQQDNYASRNLLDPESYIFDIINKNVSDFTDFKFEDKELEIEGKRIQNKITKQKIKCPVPKRLTYIEPKDYSRDISSTYVAPTTPIYKDLNIKPYGDKETEKTEESSLFGSEPYPNGYSSLEQWEACSVKESGNKIFTSHSHKGRVYISPESVLSNSEKEIYSEYVDYKNKRRVLNNTLDELEKDGITPKNSEQFFMSELRFYNMYIKILDVIQTHNAILAGQTSKNKGQLCDNPTRSVWKPSTGMSYSVAGTGGGGGYWATETIFKWKDICKDRGGIFTFPIPEEGRKNATNWDGNKGICCCVKGHNDIIKLNKEKDRKLSEWCGRSVGDTRYWYELDRIGDAIVDCVTDWHCVADVISIVAYAFGPWGAVVSGIVDAISAIGYVIEGDPGWKLNAGLTALGIFGIGEGFSLAKRGIAFSGKLEELGAIAAKYTDSLGAVKNSLKLEREMATWASKLSKEEREMYNIFIEFSKKLEKKGGQEFLQKISKEMEGLSSLYKGVFADILKKESPEVIEKLLKEAGGDFKKMIRKYFKGGKQAIIQSSIFVTLYGFSDKMGKGLLNWCERYGFDPLGVFDDECKPIETKEGNTEEISSLENVDFTPLLLKDPEFVGELEGKLNSLTPETEYSFDKVNFEGEMIGYRDALKNIELAGERGKKLEESVIKLHKKLRETINGYGSGNSADPLNSEKINEKINIVLKVYEKIINSDFEGVKVDNNSFQRLIDEALNDLEDKKGNKVTEEAKKVIQQTGNPDSGTEQISMFNNIMGTIEDIGGGEVDNSDNEKTDLKEEIKRIKSLFGDDRVYGNLIK